MGLTAEGKGQRKEPMNKKLEQQKLANMKGKKGRNKKEIK